MAELESLSFRVDSTQLKDAADKIAALVAAITALEATQKSAAQVAKESGKAERQIAKDAAALIILKQKLAEAEAKAAAAANGTAGANRTSLTEGEKLAKLMQRLTDLHKNLSDGYTRGESSILQMAKSFGATADQINQVKIALGQISGLSRNPFDSAIGATRNIQRELDALNDRARLAAQGIFLTTSQLQDFSRIGNEIRGKMTAAGIDHTTPAGLIQFNAELKKQQDAYLLISGEVNRVTAEEKKRNDVLNAQRNIMADLEQKNKSIQESINRNSAMTSSMQGGMTQANAGTHYDNARSMVGATPEQLARIQERITLTQKLTESERLLNVEQEKQNELLKHIEGIVAQQKAIQDLNKSIIENVAERKKMDDLVAKYSAMGLNSSAAKELATAEFKGASQASLDTLKNYLKNVQDIAKALHDQKTAEEAAASAAQKTARDAAASRYSAMGHSSSIANTAAGMEVKGVSPAAIASYIQEAKAKEDAARATRDLANANKFIIDTEERLAAAVNNANQNLNRQSTDELAKYQRALATVGTSTEDTTRKMAALKTQLDLVAGKERQNQLNHLSRAISTQMGDVGVSLAGGMNPLTVMMQQGDQIRFALMQAGAEGAELQKAMNNAASMVATSIATTFGAMGRFVTGVFTSVGKAIASPVTAWQVRSESINNANMLLRAGFIDTTRHARLLEVANLRAIESLGSLATVIKGGAIVALALLAIAFFQVIKQEQQLSKAIVETGASLGYSKDSAVAFASSLNGITTNVAIEAVTEFAKAGVRGTESTEKMMLAAIDLEKYGGAAIEATAASYAKLQGEPMKALQDLAEASGRVTVATLEKAKAYSDAGDRAALLGLAEDELARVTEEKAQAMKASMSPIQKLWLDVKHAVGLAWEEIQNLTRSGPIVEALRLAFQSVAVASTTVWYQIKRMASALASLPAIAGAAFDDITNLDTNATATKRMIEAVKQGNTDNKAAYDEAIKSIMASGKASKEAAASSVQSLKNNTELARSFGNAAKAEEKYLDSINRMKRERNQLEGQYNKLKGQGKEGTAAGKMLSSAMGNLDERIKDAEEAKAKKDKGPKGPKPAKSSFSGVASEVSLVDNTSNLQREYSSELSKQQKFIKSQRDILKLSFEAGLVSRGEYVAKDINLINQGQSTELATIAKHGELIKAEHDKMILAVEARRKDALRANKDSGAAVKINRDAEDQLKKINESYKTFQETQDDKSETIGFETQKRYFESLKEQNTAIKESKKDLEDLNKAKADASEASKLEVEYIRQAMFLSDSELASYKGRTAALADYIKLKSKLAGLTDTAEKDYIDFTATMGFDAESLARGQQLWLQWQTLRDQQTKLSISSELAARNAATDEYNKYYMNRAMEVRDGTANAITEGIMNGGKAGSDAIKNVLDNILKDLLNNVFKKALGSIGDSVVQAMQGGQQQDSGGGFLKSLVGFGLNALGGMSGGGAGDMGFGGLKPGRAVGGFVNKGTEYMVGENGPEKFVPKQTGSIVPNHKLASQATSSDPMKVTIINNTSAPIGKVTERQISATDRALIIEEAVMATAAQFGDPNSRTSKSLNNNYRLQRNR